MPAPGASAVSLRRGLAQRLAFVLVAALLALVAVVAVVAERANRSAGERQIADAAAFLERRFAAVDRGWLVQADVLRAQIEFSRALDAPTPAELRAQLGAFFAVLGGESPFSHVQLLAGDGAVLFGFATSTQQDLPPATDPQQRWVWAEGDGLVYRRIAQPVLVAGRRAQFVVHAPLDRALLRANSHPGTAIELRWQGRPVVLPDAPHAPRSNGRQREIGWAGLSDGPQLVVHRHAPPPLEPAEVAGIAALGGLAFAALGWLVLGRWLARLADRLLALQQATAAFAEGQRVTPQATAALAAARGSRVAEIEQLLETARAMMLSCERNQSDLAELNATLEARVQERTRELEVARDEALAAARAKERFVANLSHELRTPLVGLLGSLDLVRPAQLDAPGRELLGIARGSGEALLALINELLDFARIEAGQLALRDEAFDPVQLVDEVVQLFSASARSKGVALGAATDGVDAGLRVVGDRQRLRQVLLNLVANAVKFTPRGEVRVQLDQLERRDGGLRLRFAVQDSGIGIAPADHQRIFLPFVQAGGAGQTGGTGLGLPISQRLVEAMGGRIELHSEPGRGARFGFVLHLAEPAAPAPAAALRPAVPEEPAAALAGRVLVVDDNPVNRLVASEMLRRLGLQVEEAEDGEQAVVRVTAEPFDLVLMDCLMPVLDGYGATRVIREYERRQGARRVAIVALTANAMAGDVARCLEAGMDAHLAKPFTLPLLRQAVLDALAARAQASAEALD